MTRKLHITARQVTAICRGAEKAGFIPEIILDGVVVRLVPQMASQASHHDDLVEPSVPWPGPELNYRENHVLKKLIVAAGEMLPASTIAYAGPATVNALVKHGFVELEKGIQTFDRSQCIRATQDGIAFVQRYEAHRRQHFYL
ncbi:hypothetical protein [Nitratireductor indicus]|nr:hypothetical protein [Nitratireductor indicus]SFQ79991.1 hypothetical protein SAMN05216176_11750 [Nitratireductor indicus]